MKTAIAALCAVALLAGLSLPASAQKVGSWCEYQVDASTAVDSGVVVRKITEVAPDGGYMMQVSFPSGRIRIDRYDTLGRVLARDNTAYAPAWGGPVFPDTKVGEVAFSYTHPGGKGTVVATTKVVAVTSEKVTVVAGTFDSVKVATETSYHVSGNNYRNKWVQTAWFSSTPTVTAGQYLKSYFNDYGRPAPETYSLVRCGG